VPFEVLNHARALDVSPERVSEKEEAGPEKKRGEERRGEERKGKERKGRMYAATAPYNRKPAQTADFLSKFPICFRMPYAPTVSKYP
jgi:hypothetical protein